MLGHEMPFKSVLAVALRILAEYELVAMQDVPVHAYLEGVWFFGNLKFGVGEYIMSQTLDEAYSFLQKSLSWACIND